MNGEVPLTTFTKNEMLQYIKIFSSCSHHIPFNKPFYSYMTVIYPTKTRDLIQQIFQQIFIRHNLLKQVFQSLPVTEQTVTKV